MRAIFLHDIIRYLRFKGEFQVKIALSKALTIAVLAVLLAAVPVFAYANSVTYSGQGLIADGFGGYDLRTEICGVDNGADADGPYLLWVLTATGSSKADITGPWGTAAMTKFGNGTFKFVSGWYDPDSLPGTVSATYDGKAKNVQLVISHGCRPYTHGAWCSPGFWMNAEDAAWALTGYSRSDLFNSTVYDAFYGATYAVAPTLDTVLTTKGGTYKGASVPGTLGYPLNAFNATGAFLTNNIPGYQFDYDDLLLNDDSQTCPLDHHGNFKMLTAAVAGQSSGGRLLFLPALSN
jgi:hypothetical protein